jgi:hypothetical protein
MVNLSVHLTHPDSPKWHAIGEIYKGKRDSLTKLLILLLHTWA